jgi:hypothetical protein
MISIHTYPPPHAITTCLKVIGDAQPVEDMYEWEPVGLRVNSY